MKKGRAADSKPKASRYPRQDRAFDQIPSTTADEDGCDYRYGCDSLSQYKLCFHLTPDSTTFTFISTKACVVNSNSTHPTIQTLRIFLTLVL